MAIFEVELIFLLIYLQVLSVKEHLTQLCAVGAYVWIVADETNIHIYK